MPLSSDGAEDSMPGRNMQGLFLVERVSLGLY